jgi:hypothetical protein
MNLYTTIPERLKAIYNNLQDAESQIIFNGHLQYYLDKDINCFIEKVILPVHKKLKLNKVIDEIRNKKQKGKNVIFYGAGAFGKNLLKILNYYNFNPDYFCDSDIKKQQSTSIQVISPDELFSNYRDSVVIITTYRYLEEIREILISGGFESNDIYDQFVIEEQIRDENYWKHSFLSPVSDEIYIDGGVLNCETIKYFIKFERGGGGEKKVLGIWAFTCTFFRLSSKS